MNTTAILGPSDLSGNSKIHGKDESYFVEIANYAGELFAKRKFPVITVPYKGIGYYAAKAYLRHGGPKLIGVLPSGIESTLEVNEIVLVDNWVQQPEALVSRAGMLIVIGLSAGTMMEICLTKRFKKYPVIIFESHTTGIPKEIENELNITYVRSSEELEQVINGLTKGGALDRAQRCSVAFPAA